MDALQTLLPYLTKSLPSLLLLALLLLSLRKMQVKNRLASYLSGYLLTALVVQAARALVDLNLLPWLDSAGLNDLELYGTLLASALLLQVILLSAMPNTRPLQFLAFMAWVIVLVVLKNSLLIFASWVVFSFAGLALLMRAWREIKQPLQRNLIGYFFPIWLMAVANDVLAFYGLGQNENTLRLGAAVLLTYVFVRVHLPDTRDLTRQFLTYFTTAVLTMTVYAAGFLGLQLVFAGTPGLNPLLIGAGVAVAISLFFAPLLGLVRNAFNRMFGIEMYDPAQTLREYSTSISNILDLEKLATVAVGLIMEALEIKKGFLFLVDPEIGEDGKKIFKLSGIRGAGNLPTTKYFLTENSSITRYLNDRRESLLQYDVDFAPEFLDAPLLERKWMSQLSVDVYVPVYAKGEWIGLLALGPKGSGRRYTDEDLNLLEAIASQTGVALENARLVANLKKLNDQIREAYAFLDKANHDLAKIEMTKSNFISIASHELRTPLTVARGYAEMALEDPSLPDNIRELIKGIHKAALRLHEIMDSMFDIAQIDSRTLELHRQDVFPTELIGSVAQELSKIVSERQLELSLDLPQLPSIKADPNTLRKLFYHLMINAVKFTPNHGKVTVTARQISANNRDLPEGGVEVIVSDTGVGIDKASQEIIFTKFYQPGELLNRHSTGKTKFKGSGVGLGLALSRGIVEAHGGKIWVESPGYDEEKCPGSEFHVILPLRSQGESKTVRMGSAVKLKL